MATGDALVGLLEDGLLLEFSNCMASYSVRAFVVENVGDVTKIAASYWQVFPRIEWHVVGG